MRRWPADLRLVAHAAEADANELAAHRGGDRASEARLADTWRPDQTEDLGRPARRGVDRELAHGEEVEDPLLDGFQTEMVCIQNPLGLDEIQLIFARFLPRQREDGVEIGPDDGRFGGDAGHPFEAADLLEDPVCDFGGHAALRDLGAQLRQTRCRFRRRARRGSP